NGQSIDAANSSCGDYFERQQLTSVDNQGDSVMGAAVAIDGSTAVVGLPEEDVGGAEDAGAVLVFTRDTPNTWALQARLEAPQPPCGGNRGDQFGNSVAISGDRIVVGAPYDDFGLGLSTSCPNSKDAGSIYIFERNGTTWSMTAWL